MTHILDLSDDVLAHTLALMPIADAARFSASCKQAYSLWNENKVALYKAAWKKQFSDILTEPALTYLASKPHIYPPHRFKSTQKAIEQETAKDPVISATRFKALCKKCFLEDNVGKLIVLLDLAKNKLSALERPANMPPDFYLSNLLTHTKQTGYCSELLKINYPLYKSFDKIHLLLKQIIRPETPPFSPGFLKGSFTLGVVLTGLAIGIEMHLMDILLNYQAEINQSIMLKVCLPLLALVSMGLTAYGLDLAVRLPLSHTNANSLRDAALKTFQELYDDNGLFFPKDSLISSLPNFGERSYNLLKALTSSLTVELDRCLAEATPFSHLQKTDLTFSCSILDRNSLQIQLLDKEQSILSEFKMTITPQALPIDTIKNLCQIALNQYWKELQPQQTILPGSRGHSRGMTGAGGSRDHNCEMTGVGRSRSYSP